MILNLNLNFFILFMTFSFAKILIKEISIMIVKMKNFIQTNSMIMKLWLVNEFNSLICLQENKANHHSKLVWKIFWAFKTAFMMKLIFFFWSSWCISWIKCEEEQKESLLAKIFSSSFLWELSMKINFRFIFLFTQVLKTHHIL